MSRVTPQRALVFVCCCLLAAFVVRPSAQAPKEPGVVVLKGNPMGGVKFDHKVHAHERAAGKCETCHHPSKPEKPMAAKQQKCQDCHTKAATPPMKTAARGAFHDPMAKAGTCVNCHTEQNAKGKKAPAKCTDCHKKENV